MAFDSLTKTQYVCSACELPIYYDGLTDEMGCQNELCSIGMMPKDDFINKYVDSKKVGKNRTVRTTVKSKEEKVMAERKHYGKCSKHGHGNQVEGKDSCWKCYYEISKARKARGGVAPKVKSVKLPVSKRQPQPEGAGITILVNNFVRELKVLILAELVEKIQSLEK